MFFDNVFFNSLTVRLSKCIIASILKCRHLIFVLCITKNSNDLCLLLIYSKLIIMYLWFSKVRAKLKKNYGRNI